MKATRTPPPSSPKRFRWRWRAGISSAPPRPVPAGSAAFVLPILQRLSDGKRGVLRALILVPTRELAEQVSASIRAYGRHTHLKGAAVYGGVGMEPQTRALK